jgi:uncharacterized membrane protein
MQLMRDVPQVRDSEVDRRTDQLEVGEESLHQLSDGNSFRAHRILSLIAAIALFGPAFATWSSIIQLPVTGLLSVLGFAAILAVVLAIGTVRTEESLRKLDLAILTLALILLVGWAASQLYLFPAYGTDEGAFEQYAAQLLLHGHNPYTANMLPALIHFRVPIQYATYTLNGMVSSTFAYPSLAFLLVVPFIPLTHGVQSVIVGNVVFLAIEMVLLFFFLPRRFRAVAPIVVVGLPILFGYTVAGINDALLGPFLLIVAYKWSDIGRTGHLEKGGVVRAVSLGLAASISPLTWFIAPFVLLGIWRHRTPMLGSRSALSLAVKFGTVSALAFLVVNGPFILWSPSAWLTSVGAPLFQHAIPYGQGLIDASVFFHLGGGNLAFYTYASIAIMAAALVIYVVYFRRIWMVTFILPSAVLFFPMRSLAEYFMTLISVWAVSIVVPGDGPSRDVEHVRTPMLAAGESRNPLVQNSLEYISRVPRWVLVLSLFVPGALLLTLALSATAPLVLSIRSVQTSGQLEKIWKMKVEVTNRSGNTLKPHFATNYIGQMTTFWHATGPTRLKPGETATYTLVAPNIGSMPGITQPLVLQAVTAKPESISSTDLYTPEHFDSYISPSYEDHIVASGHNVTLHVDLLSPYGGQIHKKGVRVALSQLIYAQSGLIPSEARINDTPEGQTPVNVATNANGVAVFHVTDSSIQAGNPVYFQSYVNPIVGFPYGYSEIISVVWRASTSSGS